MQESAFGLKRSGPEPLGKKLKDRSHRPTLSKLIELMTRVTPGTERATESAIARSSSVLTSPYKYTT
jgi:hypothetical protein